MLCQQKQMEHKCDFVMHVLHTAKRHMQFMSNSEEIKPVALSIVGLELSVNQSA